MRDLTTFDHVITLDIETYYDNDYSLRKMTMTEYIQHPQFKLHSVAIKDRDNETQYFDTDHVPLAIAYLKSLRNWAMVGQNTQFDAAALNWRYGVKPDFYYDTMSMGKGFWPTESSSLKELALRIFPDDTTKRKGEDLINFLAVENLTPEQHVVMKRYNVQDVDLTWEIFNRLLGFGFPEEELYQIHMVMRMYVEPMFVIDRPLLESAIEEDVTETEAAINAALEFIKNELILNQTPFDLPLDKKLFSSNQRFARLLKEVLGVEPPIKTNAKGAPTYAFGKRDVQFIEMRNENPGLECVFNARELSKSTIAASRAATMLRCSEPSPTNPDGRLPVPLRYYGAATGRMSGADSINLQNLQRASKHRLALTAPENHLVYVADSSNIEARVNAWFAGQTDLLDGFRHGLDVYSEFASDVVFGYPVDKSMKTERQVGKVCILGLGYGMGWRTFQRTLRSGPMGAPPMECSDDFAKKCVYGYREKYPMIAQNWQIATGMIAQMATPGCDIQWGPLRVLHNCILLPNGLWLSYPGLRRTETEHANGIDIGYEYWNGKFWKKTYGGLQIENLSQCLAGLVIKEAMNKIDRWLVEHNIGKIVLQVHDEIIVVARDDHPTFTPDVIQSKIQQFMCENPAWCPDLPLDAEGGYAKEYSK